MPFADYENFDQCVQQNADKEDPKAYCATIMRNVEGKTYSFFTDSIAVEVKGTKDKEYFITGYISTPERD
jgi:hypothetical protein